MKILTRLPRGFLDCAAHELEAALGGPTLIHLEGGRQPAVFVSVLLHGNETSGWDGLRLFLDRNPSPQRNLTIFIGNVAAAARGMRVLPGQKDFNRIWRNTSGAGGALAVAFARAIADREFFAAVDLHNNTGHNPFYSVLTDLDPVNFGLAYMFSDKAVFIREPRTTMTGVFSGRCPAVALETGPIGDSRCAIRVYDFLERCLALDVVDPVDSGDLELFEALARVHVRPGVDFSIAGDGEETGALVLTGGVEAVNFHELAAGTPFASSDLAANEVLQVLDAEHDDVTDDFFAQAARAIYLKQAVVPAMYTTDPYVVQQDCLCYFMRRFQLQGT